MVLKCARKLNNNQSVYVLTYTLPYIYTLHLYIKTVNQAHAIILGIYETKRLRSSFASLSRGRKAHSHTLRSVERLLCHSSSYGDTCYAGYQGNFAILFLHISVMHILLLNISSQNCQTDQLRITMKIRKIMYYVPKSIESQFLVLRHMYKISTT